MYPQDLNEPENSGCPLRSHARSVGWKAPSGTGLPPSWSLKTLRQSPTDFQLPLFYSLNFLGNVLWFAQVPDVMC